MRPPPYPFSTALVTGASSGLGRALAQELGRGGVALAVTSRRQAELQSLAGEICDGGGKAAVLAADLAQPSEAFRIVDEASRALGRIDLIIANAGIGRRSLVIDLPWQEIEHTFRVNTLGAIAVIKAALPAMIERRSGYVAGISSLASYRGVPGDSHYSSSKAALSIFLESLRVEIRKQGVSVTDVHPGFIRTPMTAPNKGPMPFLMEPARAARLILRAIARRRAVYDFPWQMRLLVILMRILPPALYDMLASQELRRR